MQFSTGTKMLQKCGGFTSSAVIKSFLYLSFDKINQWSFLSFTLRHLFWFSNPVEAA